MSGRHIVDGVDRAVGFWLEQHPVSSWEGFEAAVAKAVTAWLDGHEEQILAAVGRAVERGVPPAGGFPPPGGQ
jgi:hypothetical protein